MTVKKKKSTKKLAHDPLAMLDAEDTAATADEHVFALGADLTIADVAGRKTEFQHILSDGLPVRFDAGELEHIDGAGLQLLAALFTNADRLGVDLSWQEVSAVLHQAAGLLGLQAVLRLPQQESAMDDGEGTAWGLF